MNILLPILANVVLALFLVLTMLFERKNGLLAMVKTVLFTGAVVGAYFITPILLPLLEGLTFITIDITSKLVFRGVLALIAVIEFSIISLIILIIRKAVIRKRIRPAKSQIEKVKTRKIQSKEKRIKELKIKKAREKEAKKRLKLNKGKQAVGLVFGFITAVLIAFTLHFPVKFLIQEIKTLKPELEYLEVITEYTPFGQLEKLVDFEELLK